MPYDKPTEPDTPDYYSTLGVWQFATAANIKQAFHKLALLHHPDKKAPGETIDAIEFRRVSVSTSEAT
jgi:DnaJ-class molecular chaperone